MARYIWYSVDCSRKDSQGEGSLRRLSNYPFRGVCGVSFFRLPQLSAHPLSECRRGEPWNEPRAYSSQVVVREFSAAASQYSQAKAELRSIETRLAYGAHKVRSFKSTRSLAFEIFLERKSSDLA